jgi:hypothetical protein
MLKWLLKSLLVLAVFVPFATALPVAALWLCRTPNGAQLLFWLGPWSCCFWVLIYSTLSTAPWRQGADAVREWREAHGGLLITSMWATAWMFAALFFSYLAEFLLVFLARSGSFGRMWLPAATYSPLAFCWVWRHCRT